MPELPEVETTRRGLVPHLVGHRFTDIRVREPRLRWPVPPDLAQHLTGRPVQALTRRGKYLLIHAPPGIALLHLGMSGSLRLVAQDTPAGPHDHVDLGLDSGRVLRLHDPRRFGSLHWFEAAGPPHPLLARLGPEPLEPGFDGAYLHRISRGRRSSIKALIMNAQVVAGIGNIYATEALFLAGIRPRRAAGRITRAQAERLVAALRQVLEEALEQGGTTLRDFLREDGRPGYFAQSLRAYGRAGLPCPVCHTPIRRISQQGRSSYYCPRCQQ
ncbi:bifunctional DNA-formamidopyrimidine glycosylase/DNA-(apurinic or apyrimidinic site) lyase [Ectothiorhodospira mobilis]|uniref:bifunctional DNA-formamidopyrimidine glycosylase/DNA-(apurinic or apyrimidinic site) lyase n=1 Tax=Ectothiorhodospira mobilis TaxID=195064 RepID=UPI00190570F2|nr:bifunctional DNA-formamidopyrimidine glycosylase/DNA-(apurinic or apyrimidinic site) lyase [Ectothiorhodospira mobilis]MBK1691324.1 DNA-formamidopyrimidine glycosylase [Ectothiorhodospira mobilis]